MTLSPRFDDALARLTASLHRLQEAVEQRTAADAERADREQEFALLQDDRARLAAELDAELAERARLLAAQQEVVHRLDRAGRTVEGVLQRLSAAGRQPAAAMSGESH